MLKSTESISNPASGVLDSYVDAKILFQLRLPCLEQYCDTLQCGSGYLLLFTELF